MAKHTEHYGLTKPEANDFYDIEVGNTNLDVINELIKGNEEAIEDIAGPGRTMETVVGAYAEAQQAAGQVGSVDGKIGSTGDVGGSTTAGSVFAKMNAVLQKFVAAWTDGRAAKLDNLDAAVSSRAAANTALSNGVWTNARAGLMDRLDGTISSRASQTSVNTLQGTATAINDTKIGVTNNIGGTATAGTVMAKLNALISRPFDGYYGPRPRGALQVISGNPAVWNGGRALIWMHNHGSVSSGDTCTLIIDNVEIMKNMSVYPGQSFITQTIFGKNPLYCTANFSFQVSSTGIFFYWLVLPIY